MALRFNLRTIFLLLSCLITMTSGAINEPACYDPGIRTITVNKGGFDLSQPIIELNSDEFINVSFDDLSEELRYFRYTIVHCNADWSVSSEITPFEYIAGFNEEQVTNYQFSNNTRIDYIHYTFRFPTENLRPRISGNYLLKVYDEDPSHVVFVTRIMVSEPSKVNVACRIEQSMKSGQNFSHQQVNFTVKLNGLRVYDIGREIRVCVRQNSRWDNVMMLSQPRFTRDDLLDYRFDENICFNGGNQFRNFDIRSLKYQTERVGTIIHDPSPEVFLLPDPARTYKQYSTEADMNGQFMVLYEDYPDQSATEAEYALVHFFLQFPAKLTSGSLHLAGDITLYQPSDENRLTFNEKLKGYEGQLLVKQGYYNYTYLLNIPGNPVADETLTEGNHWETENDYTIYVYHRETGFNYDKLISVAFFNSRKQE